MTPGRSFKAKAVERLLQTDLSPCRLRELLAQQLPRPVHIVPSEAKPPFDILKAILDDPASEQCVVDLEVGRYDEEGFDKVQLPLSAYLSWLRDSNERGRMRGKQVYLAQWRGLEDVCQLVNACRLH